MVWHWGKRLISTSHPSPQTTQRLSQSQAGKTRNPATEFVHESVKILRSGRGALQPIANLRCAPRARDEKRPRLFAGCHNVATLVPARSWAALNPKERERIGTLNLENAEHRTSNIERRM
jgi:hypothetical protein